MDIFIEKFGLFKLINFIDLTFEEKKMVLSWRNENNVKKWMYNQENISLENHLKYIKSLKDDETKKYFVIKQENHYLGVIDFTNINYQEGKCEFGFYANPFHKILGIGRILEELSIEYSFNILGLNKIKLEVFEENKQVRNLHKKYNFKERERKIVNNKEVICMELIK